MKVVVQKWEESERGWGVRPDGYSVHPNGAALKRYVSAYWAGMPNQAPDEYSRPSGTPYVTELEVDFAGKDGIRYWQNNYPGSGGVDGWKNIELTPRVRVYLRCVDPGTDNACWVVCSKGDPGAVAFEPVGATTEI